MIKSKYLAVAATAVAATTGAGSAEAAVLVTQDFNYALTPTSGAFDVTIGSNATSQYSFFLNGSFKAVLESADGVSGIASTPGTATIGTPSESYEASVKTGDEGNGYYHLQFDLNGETTYGYATLSDNGSTLDSVTYESAVPEPETWALMILGFGATGAAMRRRRQASALASA